MTNKQKLEKLLQYYPDCYAHCEGSGCWDTETLARLDVEAGICQASLCLLNKFETEEFLPPPTGRYINTGYWFKPPYKYNSDKGRRAAIKVRIDYMIKHLQP